MNCCILPEYTLYATSSQDGTKDTFPLRWLMSKLCRHVASL